MNTETITKLREAANALANATQALRDANTCHESAILGDAVLDLIGPCAELAQRTKRLAYLVEQDDNSRGAQ